MKWLPPKLAQIKMVQASIRTEWPQISLLLILVLVFCSNAIGLLEFNSGSFPGFEFRAGVLTNSTGTFMVPDMMTTAEFSIMLISGVILALLLPLLKPVTASFLVVIAAVPPFYMGVSMPLRDTTIPMQYHLLVILVLFGMNVLLNYFAETKKKQKLINIFGRYVPPEIVEEISRKPELSDITGDMRRMTVFFCDLKNFSGISEQLNPKQLFSLLNEYLTVMTEILYKHGATIDKYIGDSIMAFWGAPVPQDDHARRAVMAAFEMHQKIGRLSGEFIEKGWPGSKGPAMGVGVNSGMMNVGNMGSKYRLAYTVIGDTVNLSSRFQNMTRHYQVSTIIGEETASSISDIIFRELDTVAVKGKKNTTRIYQPLCMKDQLSNGMKDTLARHQEALEIYYAENYAQASLLFSSLLDNTDDPYYQFMIDKISELAQPGN